MWKLQFRRVLLVLVVLLFGSSVRAQNYQLHAVYIYSFIKYVQWPGENESFTIGVLGDTPLLSHLEKMAASKKAGNRPIVIVKFQSVESIKPTNILFVSNTTSEEIDSLLEKSEKNNSLLITEKEGLGMAGSAINFVERNGKLAFELNKSSIDNAGLKVSSELSRLAIII